MPTPQKYEHYNDIEDLLKITAADIDKPISFINPKPHLPPIWFAIENCRRDIIGALLKKQTQENKINLSGPIRFAYSLGVDALKNKNLPLFINHLKAIKLIDESKVTSTKLAQYLDRYLARLSKEEFKLAINELLKSIENISDLYVDIMNQSKYINYLTTAFNGNTIEAAKEFSPEQLQVLNKAGFNHAKDQKSAKGDACARCFIKQTLQEKREDNQQILFCQDLFIANLAYAVELINKKTGSDLTVNKSGACSAFTKYWLFHEVGLVNQQAKFFSDIMEIAALTREEIKARIESEFEESKGEKVEFYQSFVKLVKDYAGNINTLHRNYEFEGQITQRTMKKSFGLELIDEYDINKLKTDQPIFAYLRLKYMDGGTGHAIGIRMQKKQLPSGQSVMEYKIWDPNDKPKTFKGLPEFIAYINKIKSNPKVKQLSIIEFSHHEDPATQAKIAAIEKFNAAFSHLNYPLQPIAGPIVSCIQLLLQHYETGVIPLNQVIPLFVYLGKILNNSGQNIDLTPLYMAIDQQSLIKPEEVDLNKLPFLRDFVDGALKNTPSLPHIVTALSALGFAEENYYLRLAKTHQDSLLEQALIENRTAVVNRFLELRMNNPKDFPVALALKEMIMHSDNIDCKNILVRLLLTGKKFTDEDYKILDKQPKSTALFNQSNPPYRKILRSMILQQVMQEIKNNKGKSLGKEDETLLAMLDYALNPIHANKQGCFDILTLRGVFSDKKTEPRQLIKEALQQSHITVNPSMQSKYPFLSDHLKQLQAAPVHFTVET